MDSTVAAEGLTVQKLLLGGVDRNGPVGGSVYFRQGFASERAHRSGCPGSRVCQEERVCRSVGLVGNTGGLRTVVDTGHAIRQRGDEDGSGRIVHHAATDRVGGVGGASLSRHQKAVGGVAESGSLVILNRRDLAGLTGRDARASVVANEVGGGKSLVLVAGADEDLQVLDVRLEGPRPVDVTVGATVIVDVVVGLRIHVVRVVQVHLDRRSDLLDVAQVLSLLGGRLGLSKDREEDSGQNRDDGDHDQQFNEGECFFHEGFIPAEGPVPEKSMAHDFRNLAFLNTTLTFQDGTR